MWGERMSFSGRNESGNLYRKLSFSFPFHFKGEEEWSFGEGNKQIAAGFPALQQLSYVNSGMLLNFPAPQFPICNRV